VPSNKSKKKKINKELISDEGRIHQKMQLWTNKYENEYAICLAGYDKPDKNFLARTNAKERYTHIVAESDNLEDLKHGWDYALRGFIHNYKKERLEQLKLLKPSSSLTSVSISQPSIMMKEISDSKKYPIKLIPRIKCLYCNLDFYNEDERKEHELTWHI
jgi:hypothetical protein